MSMEIEEKVLNEGSTRLPGFYSLSPAERVEISAKMGSLDEHEKRALESTGSLTSSLVDTFIENGVGAFELPLGVATNFMIDGEELLIPMAVEETSVLAAASHGAKLARYGGGFKTHTTDSIMTGQIQLFIPPNVNYDQILKENLDEMIKFANSAHENLVRRGGGVKEVTWRYINELKCLVIHLHVDTCDAMGANIVNTMCEKVSILVAQYFDQCETGLRILTNLTDRRIAIAECTVPKTAFKHRHFSEEEVVDRIVKAWEFAYFDPYRAATHNKGVMNGIDPVVIATGNDWRAVEAGAHAYCCKDGQYRPMTTWSKTLHGDLVGKIELPMAVGTVGGVTKLHPTARAALKLLGNPGAQKLAGILCAVGLAQNLSAIRALATEGIQQGHMFLHQKNTRLLNQVRH